MAGKTYDIIIGAGGDSIRWDTSSRMANLNDSPAWKGEHDR